MHNNVRVQEDTKYGLCHQVGSITLPFGVGGRELEREILKATDDFVKAMEMRGMILYKPPGGKMLMPNGQVVTNPTWIDNPDGEYAAFYAIDWEGKYAASKKTAIERNPDGTETVVKLPTKRATSLEETDGDVEYRIIGIFWAPERAVEMLTSKQDRLDRERAERNPVTIGGGVTSRPYG